MNEKIAEVLKNSNKILIISHKNPDGDTIGANFGLALSLIKSGKNVYSYCDSEIPFEYRFLRFSDINFTTNYRDILKEKYDIAVMVDCADRNRTSIFEKIRGNCNKLINIDHHKTNDNFGDMNIVLPDYSSTGEIIFELLKNNKMFIDRSVATCLYTAILTDTGSFRYSNTSPRTFKNASELLEYGINCWDIAEKVYESKPYKRILLLKEALNSLTLSKNGKTAIMILKKETLSKYSATGEDTDGFVNYGRSIYGVEISIFIREEDDGCKLSFRSRGNIDVAEIAKKLGGGGHKNAAGGFVSKSIDNTIELINEILDKYGY